MPEPAKTAAVLFGLGVGAMVGPSLGPVAIWSGLAIAALSLVGRTEPDLLGDGPADRDSDAEVAGDAPAGLPPRRACGTVRALRRPAASAV